MANPDRQAKPDIHRTPQGVQNRSFDEVYQVLAVALLGEYNNALYRLQVDADGNLKTTGSGGLTDAELRATPVVVDLGANNDVTVTGTVTANLSATDNAVLDNIDTSTAAINAKDLMLGTDFSAVFGVNTLLTTTQADSRANTTDAFTVNAWGQVFNGTSWDRMRGDTTGTYVKDQRTLTPYFDSDGDNTAQTMKGSAGHLYFLEVSNPNSTDAYIQLFDESGTITVGTTTPKLSLLVPAGDGTKDGAMDKTFTVPIAFANSIKYACTTTATGSTDPTTGLIVNGGYI